VSRGWVSCSACYHARARSKSGVESSALRTVRLTPPWPGPVGETLPARSGAERARRARQIGIMDVLRDDYGIRPAGVLGHSAGRGWGGFGA